MTEASPRLRREASRIGCDANHIILADLILSGYTESEAFDIAYSELVAVGAKQRIAERERELASEGYKRAYEDRIQMRRFVTEDVSLRDKETVARELNQLITQTTDAKLKAELLMKLAELQQMKKDASVGNEDPVQFFLPLACSMCPLLVAYNEFVAERNKRIPKDEQEQPVRPDEMQRLIERADKDVREMRQKEKAGN